MSGIALSRSEVRKGVSINTMGISFTANSQKKTCSNCEYDRAHDCNHPLEGTKGWSLMEMKDCFLKAKTRNDREKKKINREAEKYNV